MRRTIFELFAKSPFGPLQDHMRKVLECAEFMPELFKALEEGNEERFQEISASIAETEYEADKIKNQSEFTLTGHVMQYIGICPTCASSHS